MDKFFMKFEQLNNFIHLDGSKQVEQVDYGTEKTKGQDFDWDYGYHGENERNWCSVVTTWGMTKVCALSTAQRRQGFYSGKLRELGLGSNA